ncbi:DUF6054 family protein [Microaceticoccus formicicus]|uniref:DUF6054 family protein n=1 Tax=Microaceticoccus formicicus TaxID=3118105 RepID=UPI003CD01D77|nr:DUF6054 family protein [Peptoniphilaceae bacterium AMB_02]
MGLNMKLKGNNSISIVELSAILENQIGADLITKTGRVAGDLTVILMCFEKFYFRTGSYAGLTIMLSESPEEQIADVVGFGGGDGIFNISWGANRNFAERAAEIIRGNGFEIEIGNQE